MANLSPSFQPVPFSQSGTQTLCVLLDAHMVGQNETGNETYIVNLLRQSNAFLAQNVRLVALLTNAQREYTFVSDKDKYIVAAAENDLHRFLKTIPHILSTSGSNLLHVTYHAPFWIKTPYVVTIHDVSYRTHPQFQSVRNVLLQNLLGYLTILRARLTITLSQFCKTEIEHLYPRMRGRVIVTPAAASESWHPLSRPSVKEVETRLGLQGHYLLCVCKFQPRKNLERLIEAFIQARIEHANLQLVIAGDDKTTTGKQIRQKYRDLIRQQFLTLPGYLDNNELACLYTGCLAFVFPSLYEGFGLPVLEAMRCGAPVITSKTTSLPEVAGSSALLIDPMDVGGIANAINAISDNSDFKKTLSQQSLLQARGFTWEQTATLTAQIYHEAVKTRIAGTT